MKLWPLFVAPYFLDLRPRPRVRLRATGEVEEKELDKVVQKNNTKAILEWLEQHPGVESYQEVLKRCDPHTAKPVEKKMRQARSPQKAGK